MAIKTSVSRDTFRSDLKSRPFGALGLEAFQQGIDQTEINTDQACLPLISRGGTGSRRNFIKVNKEYIVDLDDEEIYPAASLIFKFPTTFSATVGINQLDGVVFLLTDSTGISKTFKFTIDTTYSGANNGNLTSGHHSIYVDNTGYIHQDVLDNSKASIEIAFGKQTFEIESYVEGATQIVNKTVVSQVANSKLVIKLKTTTLGSAALSLISSSTQLDVSSEQFQAVTNQYEWRLNGFKEKSVLRHAFYEDVRTDTIMSSIGHSNRTPSADGTVKINVSSNILYRQPQKTDGTISSFGSSGHIVNMDASVTTSINPTTQARFSTVLSDEVLIKQIPARDEIFNTERYNHTFRDDLHYIDPNEQRWTAMSNKAPLFVDKTNFSSASHPYGSVLERHIANMMDSNFVVDQYHDSNPLSGRVDIFDRLTRLFDQHVTITGERHRHGVFDQYLEETHDFRNLQNNKWPKADIDNKNLAFDDIRGKRSELLQLGEIAYEENSVMFIDYFDQEPQDAHDYKEEERFSRIDTTMLAILTTDSNRNKIIDRREWQDSDFVYSSTGFPISQEASFDGIMYRELKR